MWVPPPLSSARLRSWRVIEPGVEGVVGVRVRMAVREWCVRAGRCGRVKAYFVVREDGGGGFW